MFIASKFFFIGVALAIWAVIAWGLLPIYKVIRYIVSSPRLYKVRTRAVCTSAGIALAALLLMFVIPLPMHSRADGVIWVPEQAIIRAGSDGFIVDVLAESGSAVKSGDSLLRIHDELAETELLVHTAELAEARARHDEVWLRDRVRAEVLKKEILHREDKLRRTKEKLSENIIRSEAEGIFIIPQPQDLPGRYIRKGTPLAHVLNLETLTARVVIFQDKIDLVRQNTLGVEVCLAENLSATLDASIQREVPAASDELPSSALGSAGGGSVATDPYDQRGVRAMERVFQFDLNLPAKSGIVNVGGHVYARFYHGWEPVAYRWYRDLRLLFLSRFNV
jgi:putative peptide zinc metalloprotease protein